jgi:hypothetical protein
LKWWDPPCIYFFPPPSLCVQDKPGPVPRHSGRSVRAPNLPCVELSGRLAYGLKDRAAPFLLRYIVYRTFYRHRCSQSDVTISSTRETSHACRGSYMAQAIRTHSSSISSSILFGHQDSLLYTHFSRSHPSSISSSIHCGVHLSLYLNISM